MRISQNRACVVGVVLSALALIVPMPALSQEDRCDAVLAATTIKDNTKKNISLATLDLVTKDNYEAFKNSFSGSAAVPIEGVPVDISGDYKKFSESRQSMREEHRFDLQVTELRDLSVSFVPDKAVGAWVECIAQGKSEVLLLRPKLVTDEDIVIHAKWQPGAVLAPGKWAGQIVLGAQDGWTIPETFSTKWVPLHFKRKPGRPFSLDITLENGNAPHIDLPKYSPIYDSPPNCLRATANGCGLCLIRIESELSGLSPGNTKEIICPDMIPSTNLSTQLNLVYSVKGAPSRRTLLSLDLNGTKGSDNHPDFEVPGSTVRTFSMVDRTSKVSSVGQASAIIRSEQCRWANDAGTGQGDRCAIEALRGSYIRFTVQ